MAITKEKAIDILEMFDFFQGQRAGRELWNDKPFEVQEQDIKDFARDVALLKEFIVDVVPKSEVERLQKYNTDVAFKHYNDGKKDVAREIFEEIERFLYLHFRFCKEEIGNDDTEYVKGRMELNTQIQNFIAELKKKYTEDNDG